MAYGFELTDVPLGASSVWDADEQKYVTWTGQLSPSESVISFAEQAFPGSPVPERDLGLVVGSLMALGGAALAPAFTAAPAAPAALTAIPTGGAAALLAAGPVLSGPSAQQAAGNIPQTIQSLAPLVQAALSGQQGVLGQVGLLAGAVAGNGTVTGPGLTGETVVKRWRTPTAEFAIVRRATKRGYSDIRMVYSRRRGMWLPVRQPRNIVIGAKELRIASALGHKRKVGKRRLLQIIARPAQMRRYWRGRRK